MRNAVALHGGSQKHVLLRPLAAGRREKQRDAVGEATRALRVRASRNAHDFMTAASQHDAGGKPSPAPAGGASLSLEATQCRPNIPGLWEEPTQRFM